MSESKILIVVEGERTEPRFIKKLICTFRDIADTSIFSYRTNVHVLYDKMFSEEGDIFELTSVLKEHASEEDRRMLSQKFTEIFLIFDAEFQDNKYDPDHIRKMLDFFNESTVNGKLYLNYPMMESFKHMSGPWSDAYLNSVIDRMDIPKYKEIVGNESSEEMKTVSKYQKEMFMMIITMNAIKTNILLNKERKLPTSEEYLEWTSKRIFDVQSSKLSEEERIFILNTSVFNILDYSPERILSELSENLKINLR